MRSGKKEKGWDGFINKFFKIAGLVVGPVCILLFVLSTIGLLIEHFDINGIWFEYTDYEIMNGYHKSASHGGLITGNGQYLKIKYVVNESYGTTGNVILYLAETEES